MGPQSVTVTDCNGCTETNAWFVMVNTVPGCTDSSATNYNPLANVNDSSCLYLGCTDSLALNFDSTANLNDSSCVYLCNYYGLNTVVVVINSGNWANDISWDITNSNGLILGSGSGYYTNYTDSVGVDTICLADGCYNFNMYDSYGNGWTGGNYVIYVNSVSIATGGLLSGSFGTDQFQVGTSIPCPIFGCTDSLASNYSVLATVDDSSCVYCVGTTLTLEMYDSYGDGWNGAFFVLQELASSSVAISTTLTGGYYGSETFNCIPDGCYNLTVSSGTYPYEVSWHLLDANGDTTLTGGAPFNGGLNLNSSCVIGCMDSLALNYDSTAVLPGSCIFPIYGCTDSSAYNYDSTAVIDDGSCVYAPATMASLYFSEYAEGSSNNKYFEVYNASNDTVYLANYAYPNVGNSPTTPGVYEYWNDFDVGAVVAPGDVYIVAHPSADPIILAEADEIHTYLSNGDDGYALVYGSNPGSPMSPAAGGYIVMDWLGDWNGDPGSGWSVAGVSNGTKDHTLVRKCSVTHGNTNWVLSAGTSATSSEWEVFPQNDWTNIGQHITPCLVSIYGCTDSTALNYSPLATVDDSSCVYCVYGCVDSTALNYDPLATCNDGSCTYCVYGCMDTTQFNYSPLATCDDGSCIPIIYGCTDSTAINYYAAANTNNGTCVYCTFGCTDPLATNYNSAATCDDGSCTYPASCNSPSPTGLNVTDLTHDRAKINWADANTSLCMVEMYRVQYRELGTTAWNTKTAIGSGLCNFGLLTTSKMLWNLTPSTVYEYRAKAWYCSASASLWSSISTFTTLDLCPNILNFAVSSGSNTQATFSWTAPSTPYSFVRIKLRVDTTGSTWLTAGGYGVMYPALTRNKNGLTAGQSYRASSRTWCNPSGGAHKALTWTSFIYWTQPGSLIRVEDENTTAITNLEVYPNPSRDIFNVSFVSDEVQNLDISITNVVGEAIYNADLDQFVGQFTKEVSLATYPKGVYFLQITTDKGVVTKKLTLQ